VVRAEARLAVAAHAGALGAQAVAGRDDVVDLVTEVMHAAARVLVEKAANRRIGAERLQQLDLRVRQFDKNNRHAVRRQRLRRRCCRTPPDSGTRLLPSCAMRPTGTSSTIAAVPPPSRIMSPFSITSASYTWQVRASSAWAARWRASPCTGIAIRGRII